MNPTLRCLAETPEDMNAGEAAFLFDATEADTATRLLADVAGIVLRDGSEARAGALLDAGAPCVLLGESALRDSGSVERLVARYGGERIGLYVPVRRMSVDWSFETVSNADFRVVTPSLCEPAWEILRADGSGTGTIAHWWIGEMLQRGVHTVLLRAGIADDTDLNLCAGLVEMLGEKLWVAPRADAAPPFPPLADWIAYGQVRQIALPPALFRQRDDLLPTPVEPPGIAGEIAA